MKKKMRRAAWNLITVMDMQRAGVATFEVARRQTETTRIENEKKLQTRKKERM